MIGLAHAPFVWEVALQLRLAARLYAALSPELRRSFPDAPATPARLLLGSASFQRAYWRYICSTDGADGVEIARLKLALRRSMRRKILVATLGFCLVLALVGAGWRPYPH